MNDLIERLRGPAHGLWCSDPATAADRIEALETELATQTERADYAWRNTKAIDASRMETEKELAALRELMNCYNLGGWTDALEPMKRALKAEAELAESTRLLSDEVQQYEDLREQFAVAQAQEPVSFLLDGTRYKVTRLDQGCAIFGLPESLSGEWVALVEATDNCHMKLTAPPPSAEDAKLLELLTELEWGCSRFDRYGTAADYCPSCEEWKIDGHEKDCKLNAALIAARGEGK